MKTMSKRVSCEMWSYLSTLLTSGVLTAQEITIGLLVTTTRCSLPQHSD
jgi:hypothetical protein